MPTRPQGIHQFERMKIEITARTGCLFIQEMTEINGMRNRIIHLFEFLSFAFNCNKFTSLAFWLNDSYVEILCQKGKMLAADVY